LSLGLQWAGFNVALGVDWDRHALSTYRNNFSHDALEADISKLSGTTIKDAIGSSDLDLLAGGPSCQGFSTHGKREAEDERNFLYREYLRLVRELSPRYVLLENVKGLLQTKNGEFKRRLFTGFARLGYSVQFKTLLAADFGVPQLRERVIFLATRVDQQVFFPEATHAAKSSLLAGAGLKPYLTVGDAISDLPKARLSSEELRQYRTRPQNDYQRFMRDNAVGPIANHIAKPISEYARSIVQHVTPGNGLRSLPAELLPERFKKMRRIANGELRKDCTTLYHRLSPDKPAYTITCYFNNVSAGAFTHPTEDRAITPREAARLQSFPDTFRFHGAQITKQIGNAVPPLLARELGLSILASIRRKRALVA
jgi:DNA (cytosine-5)-methyltransferase 1